MFVLLVVDSVRNCWKSSGVQNKLTWFTPADDVGKKVFNEIIVSKNLVLHVIRKRNLELRYMGKLQKIENIDRELGSCVMFVA